MTLVSALDLIAKVLVFAGFSWAVLAHFATGGKEPIGNIVIKALSVAGLGANLWLLLSLGEGRHSALGLPTTLASAIIFFLAIRASKAAGLHVAFSTSTGASLLSSGIYRLVRHPLYLSYVIYWLSWCLTLGFHFLSSLVFVVLLALYVLSMRMEERELERNFGREYRDYRRRTSLLLPHIL